MIPDKACYDFIRGFEGCILHPYLDQRGIPTIGWGNIIYKDGRKVTMSDPPLSQADAESLFEWQVGLKAAAVNGLHILFNQNQFNALCDFAYNEGVGALSSSTLVRKARVNTQDPTIAEEFARWNKIKYKKQDGSVGYTICSDLTERRRRESVLYFTKVQ
jgi:lysozyme